MDAVVALLAEDVEMSMPPYAEWYRGLAASRAFLAERAAATRTSLAGPARPRSTASRLSSSASGTSGSAPSSATAVSVFSFGAGGITAFTTFLDPRFVAAYG